MERISRIPRFNNSYLDNKKDQINFDEIEEDEYVEKYDDSSNSESENSDIETESDVEYSSDETNTSNHIDRLLIENQDSLEDLKIISEFDSNQFEKIQPKLKYKNMPPKQKANTPSGQFQRNSTRPKKTNYTFSYKELHDIEFQNKMLLKRIVNVKPTIAKRVSSRIDVRPGSTASISTAAVNRRKQQREIDMGNEKLKKRLQEIANRRKRMF